MTTNHDDASPVATSAPANVIEALARVEAEVGGIEKKKGGEGGISYKFRGIDAIAAAAQPLLGRYGVTIVPTLKTYVVDDITVNGKPWTDTTVKVKWTIYGPGGVEDRITSTTVGVGRDNSDKGVNKAMTGAFKNLLLRVLCVGDPQDDTDGHNHETDVAPAPAWEPPERVRKAYDALGGLSDGAKANLKELAAEFGRKLTTTDMAENEPWLLTVEAVISGDQRDEIEAREEMSRADTEPQMELADANA